MGERPYHRLPSYLKAFDTCILPYRLDSFNLSCSPLKLYQYLAAGKPVVSTALPAVVLFDGLVRIAMDADQFERQVAAAQENSWENRAAAVIEIINSSFKERQV